MSTAIEQENRTQTGPGPATPLVAPPVNIFEAGNGYTIEMELPGVSKDGLEITVEGTELSIIGRRLPPDGRAEALYQESTGADYQRVFELNPAIDTSRIEATIEQGLLTLRLPKSEKAKPQKISVTE